MLSTRRTNNTQNFVRSLTVYSFFYRLRDNDQPIDRVIEGSARIKCQTRVVGWLLHADFGRRNRPATDNLVVIERALPLHPDFISCL